MNQPYFDTLKGSTVAITGANRGLGRALAFAFGEAGANLVIHARSQEKVEELSGALEALHRPCAAVYGELADPSLPGRLVETCRGSFGGVDLCFFNAGVLGPMTPLMATSPSDFSDVMTTNVDAQLRLAQAVIPQMRARGRGLLVGLTSGLGRFALPGYGAYCASKHALEGLMKTIAVEHAESGLVSVALAPGMVQTEMLSAALGGEDISAYQTPGDTAAAFVRFALAVTAEHNGQSLDIEPWL
jgi:NAD(P)-dependent dehydrogenase (short-subunit alcohol dehydrogenase family)